MNKVLVVEDEKIYRTIFRQILSSEGFQVKTAAAGRLAIELGQAFRPDVLVADWMLDDVSGLDVAETLQGEDANLRIILITGFSSSDLRADAMLRKIPVFRYLQKPFRLEHLLSAVRAAIEA